VKYFVEGRSCFFIRMVGMKRSRFSAGMVGLGLCLAIFFICSTLSLAAPAKVYFSPRGGAEKALEKLLDGACRKVCVATYFFTSRPLAAAVIRAHKRGVKIRVIIDGTNESDYSKGYYMRKYGIDVRYARGLPRKIKKSRKLKHRVKKYGIMHHKFMVVDDKIVATGSYNWTASAEIYNRENLLVLDSTSLARQYKKEFDKIWETTFRK